MIPPEQHIPELRKRTGQLLTLSNAIIGGTHVRAQDHFGNMVMLFLHKQMDHALSAFTLEDRPDLRLVVRSMIEGVAQLFWASLPARPGQPERALLWRKYEWIEWWRKLQEAKEKKQVVDIKSRSRISYHVRKYGPWYYKNKKRPVPGDYRREWHNSNVRQMLIEFDASLASQGALPLGHRSDKTFYERLYAPYSAWTHWSPQAIRGKVVHQSDGSVTYFSSDPLEAADNLHTVYFCLLVTALAADEYLKRGKSDDLNAVDDEYTTWRTSVNI